MAQEYLPAPSNVRLADLMKEHNISQPELAKEIGCSKSTISRFISGAECYALPPEQSAAHKGQDPGSSQSRKGHQSPKKASVPRRP